MKNMQKTRNRPEFSVCFLKPVNQTTQKTQMIELGIMGKEEEKCQNF